ncbi:MAG: hypothetical protein AAF567_19510 [Actinomycetota bacterium]
MTDEVDPTDDWFPLAELGERLAGLVWVERRIGELLDAWSRIESHAGASIAFAGAAAHHYWHAEILEDCLPTSDALRETTRPRPPTQGWDDAISLLGALTEPDRTAARVAAVVREAYPWLLRETTALLEFCRPIADAHVMRWLRFIEIDHHDDSVALAELLAAVQSNAVDLADRSVLAQIDLRSR